MTLPVDVDATGVTAPPRRNGELVFDAPWQGRAFGMCVAILERSGKTWDDFRPHLVRALDAAGPDASYYDCFALALEAFVAEIGLT